MYYCYNNGLNYNVAELFDDYYTRCYKKYTSIEQISADYWRRKKTMPIEFAKKHLTEEINRIEKSQALFDYLIPEDIKRIEDLSKNYIEYVKEKVGTEMTKRKSGRKAKDLHNIVESFSYLPTLADRGARLTAFYQSLEGRYIDRKTDQKVFIDIFQNITTTKKIVWIGEIKALRYMIDKLDKAGYITYPKGFTKWQITCAHFQIKKSQKEMADDKTCSVLNVENLQPTQFTKGGKIPDSIDDLDRIIRILDPKNNYNEALQDYLDAQQEHDGEINIKEALAYGLNTDIKV